MVINFELQQKALIWYLGSPQSMAQLSWGASSVRGMSASGPNAWNKKTHAQNRKRNNNVVVRRIC